MQQALDIMPDNNLSYKELARLQAKVNDKAPDSDITMVRYYSMKKNHKGAMTSLRKALSKGYKPGPEFEAYPQVKELIKLDEYRKLKSERK